MYYIYLLLCKDKSIYTGITTDIERRFKEHKNGDGGHYTRSHGATKILYIEKRATRSKALVREAAIKKLKRAEKLALIN